MFCPKCSTIDDKVIDSRLSREGHSIRRRRECLSCGHRFTTYEEIERMELLAVKRDGRREVLDRQKLLSSFVKACEKRPVSLETLELLVETILQDLDSLQQREIPTKLIGDKVMEQLRTVDAVAYVRYASVYRCFEEVGEFIEEIQNLSSHSTEAAKGFVASVFGASSIRHTPSSCAPSIDSQLPSRSPFGLPCSDSSHSFPATVIPCPSSASANLKTGFQSFHLEA